MTYRRNSKRVPDTVKYVCVYDHCVYISYAHTVIKIGYRNNTITSLAPSVACGPQQNNVDLLKL